jgi:hypothetical protein
MVQMAAATAQPEEEDGRCRLVHLWACWDEDFLGCGSMWVVGNSGWKRGGNDSFVTTNDIRYE